MALLNIKVGQDWYADNSVNIRGYAYKGGKLLSGGALAEYFSTLDLANMKQSLIDLNGFFACIKKYNGATMSRCGSYEKLSNFLQRFGE